MGNIMRSQLYRLRKKPFIYILFIAIILTEMLITYTITMNYLVEMGEAFGGVAFVESPLSFSVLSCFFTVFITAATCCGDFEDKTANYELMGGHTRGESYFGRAVTAVLLGVLSYFLLMNIPLIAASAILGWGDKLSLNHMIFRAFAVLLPVGRLCCEFVFLSFLLRRTFYTVIGGYGIILASISGAFAESTSPALALTSLNGLYKSDVWCSFGLEDSLYYIYDISPDMDYIRIVSAASIIGGAFFLCLGYVFFRFDDVE